MYKLKSESIGLLKLRKRNNIKNNFLLQIAILFFINPLLLSQVKGTDDLCGTDDRELLNHLAVGRISSPPGRVGTGWILNDGRIVTARHVADNFTSASFIEFNVPNSISCEEWGHPSDEHKYFVNMNSIIKSTNTELGNDWAIFTVHPKLGQTPIQRQNAFFNVERTTSPTGLELYGFGESSIPSYCYSSQKSSGEYQGLSFTIIKHNCDTEDGSSGGPIINTTTGKVIGIHTFGSCVDLQYNQGTSTYNAAFWDVLTDPELCISQGYWYPSGENEDIYIALINCGTDGEEFNVKIESEVNWLGTYGSAWTGTSTLIASYKNLTGQSRYGIMNFSADPFNGSSPQELDVYQGLATWLWLPNEHGFIPENNHCILTDAAFLGDKNKPYEISDQGDILFLRITAGNQISLLPGFKASPSGTNQFIAEIQEVVGEGNVMKLATKLQNNKNKNEINTGLINNTQEEKFHKSDNTESKIEVPVSYGLSQNYPNPFNPNTIIKYALPVSGQVSLKIFNSLGQEIRTLSEVYESAGYKEVLWDGKNDNGVQTSSGLYIYRIVATDFVATKKMILLK